MGGAYKRVYKDDLDQTLGTELVQFSVFVNHCLEEENDETSRHHFLYKLLVDKKVVDTCPNVEIMLRMYLMLLTNCSGERSFSKLKFVGPCLRGCRPLLRVRVKLQLTAPEPTSKVGELAQACKRYDFRHFNADITP